MALCGEGGGESGLTDGVPPLGRNYDMRSDGYADYRVKLHSGADSTKLRCGELGDGALG